MPLANRVADDDVGEAVVVDVASRRDISAVSPARNAVESKPLLPSRLPKIDIERRAKPDALAREHRQVEPGKAAVRIGATRRALTIMSSRKAVAVYVA